MTAKERALNKAIAKIEHTERKIREMKNRLELIVDEDTASKAIRARIEELKTWVYIKESVRMNRNENPLLFKFKLEK